MSKQLELVLKNDSGLNPAIRRERRQNRARWWFAQMRLVVDRAMEWEAAPQRPVQLSLTTGRRS